LPRKPKPVGDYSTEVKGLASLRQRVMLDGRLSLQEKNNFCSAVSTLMQRLLEFDNPELKASNQRPADVKEAKPVK